MGTRCGIDRESRGPACLNNLNTFGKSSLAGRDVGDVADELLARRVGGELPADEVRHRAARRLGESPPPRAGLARHEPELAHQLADEFRPGGHALAPNGASLTAPTPTGSASCAPATPPADPYPGSRRVPPQRLRRARKRAWTELGRRTHDRPGRSSPRATRRRTHRYPARGEQPATRRVTHTITLHRVKPLPAKIP